MFRRKNKKKKTDKTSLSQEEKEKILAQAKGKSKPEETKKEDKQKPSEKPKEIEQKKDLTYTDYFIGKRQVVKEKKTIETKSGQIIELPEETEKKVVNDIYQITQEDLVAIIQGVDTDKIISELALRMLTGEL